MEQHHPRYFTIFYINNKLYVYFKKHACVTLARGSAALAVPASPLAVGTAGVALPVTSTAQLGTGVQLSAASAPTSTTLKENLAKFCCPSWLSVLSPLHLLTAFGWKLPLGRRTRKKNRSWASRCSAACSEQRQEIDRKMPLSPPGPSSH